MAFECQYCGKHLTRRHYLNCHLRRFHKDQLQSKSNFLSSLPTKVSTCLEPLEPLESSLAKVDWYLKKLCPTKTESGDVSEPGKFTGSMPYIEPPARHIEKLWTEKNGDVEGSEKKKKRKRNWGINRREYNKKLRLAGKLPSVWEQSTDQKGLGPLSDDEVDEHEDDEGDIFSSGGEDTSDADNADEEGDSEDDAEKSDTDIAFDYILDEAREKLNQAENPTDELFRHIFRSEYRRYVILLRHLRKSETHKKIMATVKDVKYRDGDFEYNEALDEGIRLRRKLLDRMVPSLASETDDEEDEC